MWSSTPHQSRAAVGVGDGRAKGSISTSTKDKRSDGNENGEDDDDSIERKNNRDEEEEEERLNIACNSGAATKKTWDEWFELLLLFYKIHGHTKVTKSKYRKLHNWVTSQRSANSRQQRGIAARGIPLSRERVKKLNEIGFVWSCASRRVAAANATDAFEDIDNDEPQEEEEEEEEEDDEDSVPGSPKKSSKSRSATWDNFFALLVQFRMEKGHTRVPQSYLYRNKRLGSWVSSQRKAFSRKQSGLPQSFIMEERIKRLNQIGFVWDCRQQRRGRSDDNESEEDGGLEDESNTEEPMSGLSGKSSNRGEPAISFVKSKKQRQMFDDYFARLVQFRKEHGHTRVPQKYPDNPALARWVSRLRYSISCKEKGLVRSGTIKINQRQVERLNRIGMVWVCRHGRQPSGPAAAHEDHKLPEAEDEEEEGEEEEREEGADFDEPMMERLATGNRQAALDNEALEDNNVTPSESLESEQGKQRSSRLLVPTHDLMDDLGGSLQDESHSNQRANNCATSVTTGANMMDTAPRISLWNEMFGLLFKYKQQHGHLEGVAKDNRELQVWIENQRKAYMHKKKGLQPNSSCYGITQERIKCLESVGFSWIDQQQARGTSTTAEVPGSQESHLRKRQLECEHNSTTCGDDAVEVTPRTSKPAKSFCSDAATTGVPNDPCSDQHSDKQQQQEENQQPPPKKRPCNNFNVRGMDAHDSSNSTSASKMTRRVSVASTGEPQVHGEKQYEGPTTKPPPHDQQQQQKSQSSLQERPRLGAFPSSQHQAPTLLVTAEISPDKICFKDIVGYKDTKSRLDEILWTLAPPQAVDGSIFTGLRSESTSIFLYGPTGCGKTQLARAIAGEAKAAFQSIAPSDILGKPLEELETSIQSIFKQAHERAIQLESKCAVIFLDHIDTYGSRGYLGKEDACRSRRVLAELSIQLDNIFSQNRNTPAGPHVLVVAATSCSPQDCDPALLRRFGARLHVGLPCGDDRKEMLKRYLQDIDNYILQDDDDLLELAESLDGWSGSDLKSLTREATMVPVREQLRGARLQGDQLLQTGGTLPKVRPVTLADFVTAYNSFKFVV